MLSSLSLSLKILYPENAQNYYQIPLSLIEKKSGRWRRFSIVDDIARSTSI